MVKPDRYCVKRILDIGTGTGLLALMIAQQNPDVHIDVVEINRDAAIQAGENTADTPWRNNIRVVNTDIKEYSADHKYDVIFSNPPFYENELMSGNEDRNIALHDSSLTLKELVKIIKSNLSPGGNFFLLLPFKREQEIKKTLKENEMQLLSTTMVRQSHSHGFFRLMVEGCLQTKVDREIVSDEISIKDNDYKYTAEFSGLLRDYYLYL